MRLLRTIIITAVSLLQVLQASAQTQDGRRNSLYKTDTLKSSLIVEDIRKAGKSTQTGYLKLIQDDFTFKSVLNSPDVLKTLQMLPGVASGTEMKSDLYVRGGTGYDNLYLLENVPIYQPGHFLGMFSVFNTDMLSTVDFFKSGFPAEYGGRISSVTDVHIKEGDLNKKNSLFSIGVTDGRFMIDGPMTKGKSSYCIAFRQGWVEAFLRPMLGHFNVDAAYYSSSMTKEGNYAFSDLDAKLTWRLSATDKVTLNLFASYDFMKMTKSSKSYYDDKYGNSRWGNAVASATWHKTLTPATKFSLTGYVSDGLCDIYSNRKHFVVNKTEHVKTDNYTGTLDAGVKLNSTSILGWNTFTYGLSTGFRRYVAKRKDVTETTGKNYHEIDVDRFDKGLNAAELAIFAEDEINPTRWFSVSAALRYQLFTTSGRTYNFLEPRAAVCLKPFKALSFKMSYSRMNQPDHLLSSYLLDLPGNFWMPSTKKMSPLMSNQYSAELDFRPNRTWYISLSGFYKDLKNVIEYFGQPSISPSIDTWETAYEQGKGRAYGAEFFAEFRKGKYDLSASYTLSWAERNFPQFKSGWYPDRYDNRNKISVNLIYKAHELINIYANWTYHTGNRLSLKSYYVPDKYVDDLALYDINGSASPNNYQFPAYHRLDIGIDFKATNRKGHDYLVSFGCYNVYGRKNPMYVTLEPYAYGGYALRLTSVFPVLPTFRYTMFF